MTDKVIIEFSVGSCGEIPGKLTIFAKSGKGTMRIQNSNGLHSFPYDSTGDIGFKLSFAFQPIVDACTSK